MVMPGHPAPGSGDLLPNQFNSNPAHPGLYAPPAMNRAHSAFDMASSGSSSLDRGSSLHPSASSASVGSTATGQSPNAQQQQSAGGGYHQFISAGSVASERFQRAALANPLHLSNPNLFTAQPSPSMPPPPPTSQVPHFMTLDMATKDTPHFRAAIQEFESDVETLMKWLENLAKGCRDYLNELSRANDVTSALVSRMKPARKKMSLLDYTVVTTFADALSSECLNKTKLMETLTQDLLVPMQKYIREDVREMKDYRKIHDKVVERYDTALLKYASLPRTKEASALREDAYVLFEARKAYIRSSIEYAYRIMCFKNNLEMLIVDRASSLQLMTAMAAHSGYFELSSDVFIGIGPSMNALKTRLEAARRSLPTAMDIEMRKQALEEEAIRKANPAPIYQVPSSNALNTLEVTDGQGGVGGSGAVTPPFTMARNPSAAPVAAANNNGVAVGPSGAPSSVVAASSLPTWNSNGALLPISPMVPTQKEGHLFYRRKNWTRIYLTLVNGLVWITELNANNNNNNNGGTTNTNGGTVSNVVDGSGTKRKSAVVVTGPFSVLLCGMRVPTYNVDRRFCFEIFTPKRSLLFQAETEKDMLEWIQSLEAAKAAALNPAIQANVTAAPTYLPVPASQNPAQLDLPDDDDDDAGAGGQGGTALSAPKDGTETRRSSGAASGPRESGGATTGGEEDDDDDADEDEDVNVMVENVEDVKRIGNDIVREDPVFGEVKYPDNNWEKKNKELHRLLKSVPKSDYVVEVFAIALQRDIVIQGKIFLTQNRICFHSNILGFLNVLVIHLNSVKDIKKHKSSPFHSTIIVDTADGTHSFKTLINEEKIYRSLKSAWDNAAKPGEAWERLSSQALFDMIFSNNHKLDEKEKGRKSVTNLNETQLQLNSGEDAAAPATTSGSGAAATGGVDAPTAEVSEFDLPPSIPIPTTDPVCGCDEHLEKTEQSITLPVSAKRLFDLIFGSSPENAALYDRYHKGRGETNRTVGSWVEPVPPGMALGGDMPKDPIMARECSWIMPMNNPMVKVKEAKVNEIAYLLKKQEYFVYVVECRGMTPEVPYGDNFTTMGKYCITWAGKDQCKLLITTSIKFFKSPMIKGIIKSEGAKGLAKGAADLMVSLRQEIDALNAKTGGAPAGGDAGSTGVAAAGPEAVATTGGKPIQYSSATPSISAARPAESILPMDLSNSFWFQWGAVAFLALSLLSHALYWTGITGRGRNAAAVVRHHFQQAGVPAAVVCDGPGSARDWGVELLRRTKGMGELNARALIGYLESHFVPDEVVVEGGTGLVPRLGCGNGTELCAGRAWRGGIAGAGGGGGVYKTGGAMRVRERIESLRELVGEVRDEAWRTVRWLEEVEGGLVAAGYWNWVADAGAVTGAVGGPENLFSFAKDARGED
ncbi:hypothetical protein HK101_003697 [Irineochytrium annulatum]|nr:hypothetical protein HK101_003697 [Irineochytrium annulatum]